MMYRLQYRDTDGWPQTHYYRSWQLAKAKEQAKLHAAGEPKLHRRRREGGWTPVQLPRS